MENITNEELVSRAQGGDRNSLLMLWENNKGLVHKTIQPYLGNLEFDDLMQEAFIGLSNAVQKYDPEAGCVFSSFMVSCIRWELLGYIETSGAPVKLPRSMWAKIRQLNKTRERLSAALGRNPSTEELAREMGLSADQIQLMTMAISRKTPSSMDAPVSGDDGSESSSLGDLIADPCNGIENAEEALEREELAEVLWGIVDELPDLQSRVIRKAFQDELTYAQMAELFHVSEDAIRSARASAMKRLQNYKIRNRLAPYVDGDLIAKTVKMSSYSAWKNSGMSGPEFAVIKIEEREEQFLASYTVREVQRKVLDQYKLMLSQAEKTGDRELIQKIQGKIDDVWEKYHIR